MRYACLLLALVASLVGCTPAAEPARALAPPAPSVVRAPAPASARPAPELRELTLLYTSDEHGWMLPHGDKGGALALLQQWVDRENYCVSDRPGDCEASSTLALSGGDNWTGPAISSYFQGKSMVEAMRAIGYCASALGNHELDFGQPNLAENARAQGFDFLAANLHWDQSHPAPPVRASRIVQRNHLRIGVVGLANSQTPSHLRPGAYEGLTFAPEEPTLVREIPELWKQGPDLVVLVAHVCPDQLQQMVARHPEWNLAFAGAGHCHVLQSLQAGNTPVIEPGAELTWYARVHITLDPSRPQQQRVTQRETSLIELGPPPAPAQMAEPVQKLASTVQKWQAAVDDKLGEVIGYSEEGMGRETEPMAAWLLGAWRAQLRADAAIMNRFGMRQALGPGEIRVRDLWDILPFDNRIVIMKLSGRDLIDNAQCCNGLVDGLKKQGSGWVLADGRKVLPAATYRVVTPDYAYFGGSGFRFRTQALDAQFGADWREPIVAWMRAHMSTRARPLEKLIVR